LFSTSGALPLVKGGPCLTAEFLLLIAGTLRAKAEGFRDVFAFAANSLQKQQNGRGARNRRSLQTPCRSR
jgi:hypothetical protein